MQNVETKRYDICIIKQRIYSDEISTVANNKVLYKAYWSYLIIITWSTHCLYFLKGFFWYLRTIRGDKIMPNQQAHCLFNLKLDHEHVCIKSKRTEAIACCSKTHVYLQFKILKDFSSIAHIPSIFFRNAREHFILSFDSVYLISAHGNHKQIDDVIWAQTKMHFSISYHRPLLLG